MIEKQNNQSKEVKRLDDFWFWTNLLYPTSGLRIQYLKGSIHKTAPPNLNNNI